MEHWVYTTNILGHSVSFNLDTLITMWLSMLLLIVLALLQPEILKWFLENFNLLEKNN